LKFLSVKRKITYTHAYAHPYQMGFPGENNQQDVPESWEALLGSDSAPPKIIIDRRKEFAEKLVFAYFPTICHRLNTSKNKEVVIVDMANLVVSLSGRKASVEKRDIILCVWRLIRKIAINFFVVVVTPNESHYKGFYRDVDPDIYVLLVSTDAKTANIKGIDDAVILQLMNRFMVDGQIVFVVSADKYRDHACRSKKMKYLMWNRFKTLSPQNYYRHLFKNFSLAMPRQK